MNPADFPLVSRIVKGFAAACALALAVASPVALAQEDLPGRVGRVSNVAGELFIAPQDQPDAWAAAGLNYPVAGGDNLWVGNDGRAEVDVGGTQLRLAGDSNLHVSRLDDRQFALFVAQGRVSIRVRVLEGGEFARVDTPNAQLTIMRPGLYRVDVSPDREHTHLVVREGEVNVQTAGALQQVLPGQSADIDGANPQYATVQNGIGVDGFDAWVADRDRYYRVSSSGNYVSPQMVGAADLAQYGSWTQNSEYGAVWYPNDVPSDWAPYRNGYWVDVGAWGPTWVDYAPWGYAPFHYGRWAYVGGRWGWCPGRYVARPLWAPALVAWTGGAGWGLSVSAGGPVYGWVPLAWGEPYRPWWGRCSYGCWDRYNRPYAVNVNVWRPNSPPPTHYRNWNAPNAVTAVRGSTLYARQPVQQNLVRVSRDQVATAPVLSGAPPVRVERDSRSSMPRPVGAPPPASSFQQAYSRPSQPQGTGNMTRGSTQAMQPSQAPSNPAVSPTMRTPSQATPSQPPMQRDDSRRSPSYAQPVPPSPTQPSSYGQPSSRVAQPQVQPVTPPSQPQGQMMRAPQPVPAQPQAQAAPQPSMRVQQPPLHPVTPPSQPQGQMMRAPQSAPVQPQVHTPPPQSMRVQPQVPVPAQASPQRVAPPPAPQAAPQPAPQPRSAPDSGSHGQRDTPPGQDRGQDSSGSGNMQRQGR
jgi:hypothetical protein